jgi:CPA1 family monovalent cation:H+ antiporter
LPAEGLGFSGVLATVTAGLWIGWNAPRIMHSEARLRGRVVWEFAVFVLNGLVFILIGLQLSGMLDTLSGGSILMWIALGGAVALTVILVRMAWMFVGVYVKIWLSRLELRPAPPPWTETFVLGWAGMRGVVSLATALALPLSTPFRDALIFITFCVILVTLVGQGLSLPWLVRVLRVGGDGSAEHEELHARAAAAEAAVARIDELADQWPDHQPLIETLRVQYSHRVSHLGEHNHTAGADGVVDPAADQELLEHRQIRRAVIDAERDAVLAMRESGAINDEVWRRIERDIDLEELRMEA